MKSRPILFSAPMVRALLAGKKTRRRIVKPQPPAHVVDFCTYHNPKGDGVAHFGFDPVARELQKFFAVYPYGQLGDRLWVRETWAQPTSLDPGPTFYRADYPACVPAHFSNVPPASEITWKPSIHMFRKDSRITLEITGVRVERLHAISEDDCWAEGIEQVMHVFDDANQCAMAKRIGASIEDAKPLYAQLWESINGPGSWDLNPWVWVIEFKRIEGANT